MGSRTKKRGAKKRGKQRGMPPRRDQTQPTDGDATVKKRRIRKWLAASLSVLVAGAGLFLGLVALRSKLAVTLHDPIQKDDETDFPFVVKNENPYAVDDVAFYCLSDRIATEKARPAEAFGMDHIAQKWTISTLERNGTKSVWCNVSAGAGGTIQEGTISIMATGKAFGIPVHQCDTFVGVRGTSWTWLQQPCHDVDLTRYAIVQGGGDLTNIMRRTSGYKDFEIFGVRSFSDPLPTFPKPPAQ